MMLAVCLTTAGRAENNVWEKQEGLKCYISSLKDMTTALAEPKTATLVTLCVTSRLYGLYEVCNVFLPRSMGLGFTCTY